MLGMLRHSQGATIASIVKATGWRPHSVRGFLAGVVKKKLGLDLASEKTKSGRLYRIVGKKFASVDHSEAAAGEPHA